MMNIQTNETKPHHFSGIDVGAEELIMVIRKNSKPFNPQKFTNTPADRARLVKKRVKLPGIVVCMEATGVYHFDLAIALYSGPRNPDNSLSYTLSGNKRPSMSESRWKIFTGAQKAKVALEAVKGVKTINEIAQKHSIHPTQVSQWKKELLDNASSLFEGKRGPKPVNAQSDPDRLYAKPVLSETKGSGN